MSNCPCWAGWIYHYLLLLWLKHALCSTKPEQPKIQRFMTDARGDLECSFNQFRRHNQYHCNKTIMLFSFFLLITLLITGNWEQPIRKLLYSPFHFANVRLCSSVRLDHFTIINFDEAENAMRRSQYRNLPSFNTRKFWNFIKTLIFFKQQYKSYCQMNIIYKDDYIVLYYRTSTGQKCIDFRVDLEWSSSFFYECY